jgi:uncharacterized HAD superfamily protein
MKRTVVMCDMDGVFCNYNAGIVQVGKELVGCDRLPLHPAQCQSWKAIEVGLGSQAKTVFDYIMDHGAFLARLPSLVERRVFSEIDTLRKHCDIYFVTSRACQGAKAATEQWLRSYGLFAPTVILAKRKDLIAAAIDADFSIEDNAPNAIAISTANDHVRSFLLDYPYNQFDAYAIGTKVERIMRVEEYLKAIKESL